MREKHNLEPREIYVGVLSDDELFFNVLGTSYCGNCDKAHERGISLDSNGEVLREIKPDYLHLWQNGGLYRR